MRIRLIVAFAGLGAAAFAQETTPNTVADEFRAFTEETATQCKAVTDQLAQFKVKSDPLTGYTLRDAVQSLCVCMPAKVAALQATYPPEELARQASDTDFVPRFNAAVIETCAAEQLRALYGAECPKRFRGAAQRVAIYCGCMHDVVSAYPDSTAAAIAAAASDYLPEAADAEKSGAPAPPRPAVLESYWQADQTCKARRRSPGPAAP